MPNSYAGEVQGMFDLENMHNFLPANNNKVNRSVVLRPDVSGITGGGEVTIIKYG